MGGVSGRNNDRRPSAGALVVPHRRLWINTPRGVQIARTFDTLRPYLFSERLSCRWLAHVLRPHTAPLISTITAQAEVGTIDPFAQHEEPDV
jgi:hypothetical protein